MSDQPPTPPGEPDAEGPPSTPPGPPPASPPPPAPPPPGGTPPPSTPPPAPPGGGGGLGGSASPGGYTIGDAFNYGWTKFQANLGPILLGVVVLVVGGGIVSFLWNLVATAMFGGMDDGFSFVPFFGVLAVSYLVSGVIQIFIQAGITRGALAITYGRPIDLQTLLATDNLGQIFVGALVVAVATAIGFVLCIIPGFVVIFFTQFFVHFAIDKRMPAMDAIRASVEFVNQNLGTLIGFYIASIVAVVVGLILCFVGVLAAIPVVVIAQAYTYRVLQGESVAA